VLSQVVELIENKNNFAITTHVRPDGDGVGSSLGLCWLLRSLGKQAEVLVRDGIPVAYRNLPGADEIREIAEIDREYDAVFVIECSDIDRPCIKGLEKQFTVNIDHHSTSEHFGTINWIDATASAVGDLALVTDTGSFHFPNTTDRTLKVASELVKVGVKPAQISEAVYNSYPWSRIELMRQVLNTVRRDKTGRVAWMRQTLEMRENSGMTDGDNNGFVNIPLAAKEVVASVYMREVEPNFYRVSLRSKGSVNVARVAEKFGGGGHKNAAGCRLEGDWECWEQKLVAAMIEAVNEVHGSNETEKPELEMSLA
jgi:phosphoesterase RecJ-like protein